MSVLYSRITDLTALKKMSLAELERKLGFSNGIISTWKKSNPSIDKVEKVANLFDTKKATPENLISRVAFLVFTYLNVPQGSLPTRPTK